MGGAAGARPGRGPGPGPLALAGRRSEYPRVLPVGDAAASLELGDAIDPALNARVRALDAALQQRGVAGFREAVPSYRSLLVCYDRERTRFVDVRQELLRLARDASGAAAPEGRLHRIPTLYGGDDGPDLERVARSHGLAPAEVVRRHTAEAWTAFLLGFMPGFAYLGLLPAELATPRLATPRQRVPPGSVGIAGRQTGIYPSASPGGWNLIGRTSLRLFDALAEPPARIEPGDRVRFEAAAELPEPGRDEAPARAPAAPAVEVLAGGLLTTVQDLGRHGHRRLGVGRSGAADPLALSALNAVLGNPGQAAGLECTVAGPSLRFLRPTRFAVGGAELGATLLRDDLGSWPVPHGVPVLARAGNLLTFAGRVRGARGYVAFAGGLDVPPVLGSRATDLGAGFGGHRGRALRAGDVLGLGPAAAADASRRQAAPPPADSVVRLRVVLGPQADAFAGEVVTRFLEETWDVGASSDRIGCRLAGPRLAHLGPAEIVADGMLPGCIQVPPDGQPIVMLADSPTTGGYPKIATVIEADLGLLAQVLPGEGRVRFDPVSVDEAG